MCKQKTFLKLTKEKVILKEKDPWRRYNNNNCTIYKKKNIEKGERK